MNKARSIVHRHEKPKSHENRTFATFFTIKKGLSLDYLPAALRLKTTLGYPMDNFIPLFA